MRLPSWRCGEKTQKNQIIHNVSIGSWLPMPTLGLLCVELCVGSVVTKTINKSKGRAMRSIVVRKHIHGSTSVKFAILLMLLAGLAIAVNYRMSIPGSSWVDRMRAKPMVLNMDSLTGHETQAEVLQTYHYLHHTCTSESGPLGNTVCWATVTKVDGVDARLISFFFRDDRLSAVRVSFADKDHPKMLALMQKRFGPERQFGEKTDAFGNKIVGWIRPSGVIAINVSIEGDDEPIMLWTSRDSVMKKLLGDTSQR